MRHVLPALAALALASASGRALGAPAASHLTPQGFSGVIGTPDASVVPDGHAAFAASRLRVPRFGEVDTVAVSLGLFPLVEFGLRLTHRDGLVLSDLSTSAKLRLPLSLAWRYLPDFAVGAQDFGGAAPHFRSKYLVATESLGPLRLSVGYGFGPDRMDGLIASAEVRPVRWLRLLTDQDGTWTSVGAGLDVPLRVGGAPVRLGALVWGRADGDDRELDVAVSAEVPLGLDRRSPLDDEGRLGLPAVHGYEESPAPDVQDAASLEATAEALVEAGFENVRVGVKGGRAAYVELEDNRFHWNELDGLGVALGIVATRAPRELDWIVLVQHKTGLALRELWAPRGPTREYLAGGGSSARLETELDVSPCLSSTSDVVFVGARRNGSYGKLQIGLTPKLQTAVASEFAPFTYVLSFKPEATLTLWPGAVLNAAWEIPLAWSAQYDDGGVFQYERHSVHTAHALLYQGVPLAPGLVGLVGAGLYRRNKGGVLGELAWASPDGVLWLRAQGSYFRDRYEDGAFTSYLGSARVWVPWLDASIEATGGRYFYGDTGGAVELARYFGDTEVGIYYRRTEAEIVGARVSLPLTPRRGMQPGRVQVRGSLRWRYDDTGTINEPTILHFPFHGVLPQTSYTARDIYLNAGRLGSDYVRAHLPRLREAYRRWGVEEEEARTAR